MKRTTMQGGARVTAMVCSALLSTLAIAADVPANLKPALGTAPEASMLPRSEFVFEEYVGLSPAVVQGETALGQRQFIPITGGKVAGPKFNGEVLAGGWDYQLRMPGGCSTLSADYFLKASDGAIIHVLNQALRCDNAAAGERSYAVPRFEAPKGPHEWMTRGNFVSTIEPVMAPAANGAPPKLLAVRIRFYQIK
ncbi:MAG: DUF3237 family protein [Steroidobacteraceae bacterium]